MWNPANILKKTINIKLLRKNSTSKQNITNIKYKMLAYLNKVNLQHKYESLECHI
jgi:hypothetical protein